MGCNLSVSLKILLRVLSIWWLWYQTASPTKFPLLQNLVMWQIGCPLLGIPLHTTSMLLTWSKRSGSMFHQIMLVRSLGNVLLRLEGLRCTGPTRDKDGCYCMKITIGLGTQITYKFKEGKKLMVRLSSHKLGYHMEPPMLGLTMSTSRHWSSQFTNYKAKLSHKQLMSNATGMTAVPLTKPLFANRCGSMRDE